jgi:TRAP-type mannitol/chloroaromatic compound transport system substrate-binding protein
MWKKALLAVLIVGLLVSFSTGAVAKDKVYKWKVQGFVPAGMLYHDILLHAADRVKKVTNGRMEWEVFPAGALVPPFEGIKAVSDGVYQVNFGYAGQWVGKIQVAPLFCSNPGGFNALDMQMWLEHGGGKELYQEMMDKYGFNVKVLAGAPISMENFMWSKRPLRKIEDFKGLKIRMMPLMGDVLSKHGISVVFMPGGEIMPNLQRGVITAAEYSIPAFDKTLGIWEVCKYVMLPGIHQPTSQTEFLINKKAYASLPEDIRTQMEAAIDMSRLQDWLWMESKNLDAVDFFKEKGIETITMDDDTVNTFIKWADEYLEELSAKDPFFAKVHHSQQNFGKRWYPFFNTHNLFHK